MESAERGVDHPWWKRSRCRGFDVWVGVLGNRSGPGSLHNDQATDDSLRDDESRSQ